MRKFPLVYPRTAQRDLIEACQYIQADSPTQARAWLERVDRTLGRLAAFPESGAIPKDERLASLGCRVVVLGEYLAFYTFRRGKVKIRRVLHGRQRYLFLL